MAFKPDLLQVKEKLFDPNISHVETVSYSQIQDDKYRDANQKFVSLQTSNFLNLNEVQKITYLSGLKNLGHYNQHSSFYPDTITKLWKSNQLKEIMPKINISDSELEDVIKVYIDSEFIKNGSKSIPENKLEQWDKKYPLMCAKDGYIKFGPMLPRTDGMKDSLGIAELGWIHMPTTYSRLNIYSGLSQDGNIEEDKINQFTKTVSHLYADSLEKINPLFAKFTKTQQEIRLCSYVNDDLLMWQLKSLSKYFKEPISVHEIVRDGKNIEIRLFSGGKVGVRSSNEEDIDMAKYAKLLRLINEMKSKTL